MDNATAAGGASAGDAGYNPAMSDDRPHRPRGSRRIGDLAGLVADAAVRGVDIDAAVGEVDLDRHLARVDVNALLDRVDVDRLLEHVDVDRLLERVDVDRLLERVDVQALVQRAGIADIVAESTGQVAGTALDTVRRQVVAVDLVLMRLLYRLTGRSFDRMPAGPQALVGEAEDPVLRLDEVGVPEEMAGRYAGVISQVLATGVDLAFATGLFTAFTAAVGWVLNGVLGLDIGGGAAPGALFFAGLLTWMATYWVATLSVGGRTPGMGLVGVRVLRVDGEPLSLGRVVTWTLALPLSLPFGAGFAVMLLGAHRRTLHDRVAGAAVVYDWGRRGAAGDTPLARWLAAVDEAPAEGSGAGPDGT